MHAAGKILRCIVPSWPRAVVLALLLLLIYSLAAFLYAGFREDWSVSLGQADARLCGVVDGKLYMVYDRWAGDNPGELIVEARRASDGGLLARRGLGTNWIIVDRCAIVNSTLRIWAWQLEPSSRALSTPLLYVVDARTFSVRVRARIASPIETRELSAQGHYLLFEKRASSYTYCGGNPGSYREWGVALGSKAASILYWLYCFPNMYSILLNITLSDNTLSVVLEKYSLENRALTERIARTFTVDSEVVNAIAYRVRAGNEEILDLAEPSIRIDENKIIVLFRQNDEEPTVRIALDLESEKVSLEERAASADGEGANQPSNASVPSEPPLVSLLRRELGVELLEIRIVLAKEKGSYTYIVAHIPERMFGPLSPPGNIYGFSTILAIAGHNTSLRYVKVLWGETVDDAVEDPRTGRVYLVTSHIISADKWRTKLRAYSLTGPPLLPFEATRVISLVSRIVPAGYLLAALLVALTAYILRALRRCRNTP